MSEFKFEVTPVMGAINTNIEATKKYISDLAMQYKGIIFTEDTKTDARKTVAYLRKKKKSVEDARKEVKKQWMVPYEKFELEVKELLSAIDTPIDYINDQVEAFEQARLEARSEEIKQIYEEEIMGLEEFLPLYKIRNEKWNNASTSIKTIRKEMQDVIASARAGKTAIESMVSDSVPAALRKFQSDLNLAEALNHINAYEANKRAILEREAERTKQEEEAQRIREIERIRAEERQRILDEDRIRKEAEERARQEIATVDEECAAPLSMPGSRKAVYTVVGTEEELAELETAMVSLGLYFERKNI